MNKNNLMNLIVLLVTFSLIIIIPKVNSAYDAGTGAGSSIDSTTVSETNSPGGLEVEPVDGNVNLEGESGEITVTNEFDTIKTAGGTIPNVESGNLVVENGNPVSGKLVFSADSSFDLNDKHINVPKDGSIEFKDGKLIVSKNSIIEVEGTKIQAIVDETEIKMEKNLVEVKGQVSVDYETSSAKIILSGKGSILELQTEENEKFEFKNSDSKDLIVNIGSFHDSESEECKGKNCISYQDMGMGTNNIDEWNKIKIDGNAIITKYYEEEKIYQIKFDDGEAKLYRDLSKLKDTTFSEKTVINYNKGEKITFVIETSEERANEVENVRIHSYEGGDIEGNSNVHIVTELPTVELPEIPVPKKTPKSPETDSKLKEKARGVYIDDKTLYDIVEEKGEDIMSEDLILAWINQESSMNQDAKLGGCVGFTQVSAISFRDVINRNPEKYKEYLSYTNEELTKAIEDDALLNLEVGFDYMNSLKTTYGFSQEKVESNYKYTGNEEDILLMAYNAGPTVTKDILNEFKNNGGGNWDKLEEFLHTDEALNIFKKYKKSYGIKNTDTGEEVNSKLKWKINVVIKYIENIKNNANQ